MAKQTLITEAMKKKIPALYSTENVPEHEKVAVVKLFDPTGRWTFYVVEGSDEKDEDGVTDYRMFGWCVSALGEDGDEWGYSSLNEIASVKPAIRNGKMVLPMERDIHWKPQPVSQAVPKLRKAEPETVEEAEEEAIENLSDMDDRADELALSFINGNRKDVVQDVFETDGHKAVLLAMLVTERLPVDSKPVFARMLRHRIEAAS